MLTARIAGCVFSVSISASSGPRSRCGSAARRAPRPLRRTSRGTRETRRRAPAHADLLRALSWEDEGDQALTPPAAVDAAISCSTRSMKWLAGEPIRHRDGVAHRLRARSAVADDRHAGDAEQRRAAVLGVVHAPAEMPERPPRQQRSDAHRERARQLLAQQLLDHFDQPFADLQRDIAGEPVADDDVGVAAVDVARLDVADERERRRLEQPVRLARQLVALRSPRRRSTAGRRAAARCRARRARTRCPSRRTAADAAGGTRRWRRRRAAPPGGAASESSPPAPDDRRPAACRTRRARPSPSRRCGRR